MALRSSCYPTLVAVAIGTLGSACLEGNQRVCGSLLCPADTVCLTGREGCFPPDRVSACAELDDGDSCQAAGFEGICDRGVCDAQECGDNVVSFGEDCEGDELSGMSCLDFDFYNPEGLACGADCQFDTSGCTEFCGDGVTNGPPGAEDCDGDAPTGLSCLDIGRDIGSLGCSDTCATDEGTCRRFGWTFQDVGTTRTLNDVWVASDIDIHVVGDEIAVHFDGVTWSQQPLDGVVLRGVWVSPDGALALAVGSEAGDGRVFRYVDGVWRAETIPAVGQLRAVTGTSATDAWAVGNNGAVLRYDGATWSPVTVDDVATFVAADASAPGNVWLFGGNQAYQQNGQSFIQHLLPVTAASARVFSPTSVVVGGSGETAHYDGNTWTARSFVGNDAMTGLAGDSVDRLFGVSLVPLLSDDVSWTRFEFDGPVLGGIHGQPQTAIYAVGVLGHVSRYDGAAPSAQTAAPGITRLGSVWSPSAGEAFVAATRTDGTATLGHRAGGSWVITPGSRTNMTELSGFRDGDATTVFYGGQSYWAAFDGSVTRSIAIEEDCPSICQIPSARALHAYSTTRAIATSTGDYFFSLRFENQTLSRSVIEIEHRTIDVFALDEVTQYVAAENNVLLVGNINDGFAPFDPAPAAELENINAVYAFAPDNIYVGTSFGKVLHWDGGDWTLVLERVSNAILDIVATAEDDIFVLFTSSLGVTRLFHYDGISWSPVRIPSLSSKISVSPTSISLTQNNPGVLDLVMRTYR